MMSILTIIHNFEHICSKEIRKLIPIYEDFLILHLSNILYKGLLISRNQISCLKKMFRMFSGRTLPQILKNCSI